MADKPKRFSVRARVFFAFAIVGLLGVGVFGWAATAQLSGAVIASGSVIVERKAEVAHRDGGIVAEILVENGDRVAAGQVLIRLDATQIQARLGEIRAELIGLLAKSARLEAVAQDLPEIRFPEALAEYGPVAERVMTQERRLFELQRDASANRSEQLALQIAQLEERMVGLEAQRVSIREQLRLIRLEHEQVRGLYEDGLATVDRVLALERERTRLGGSLEEIGAQITAAGVRVSELRVQIASGDQTDRLEAWREYRELAARVAVLQEQEAEALDRLARAELVAPEAGSVHELKVNNVGAVVTPAETVLWIVPDEGFSIEGRVRPTDGDRVVVGREATLRFTGADTTTTPEITGAVVHVSADVSEDERTGEPYFVARIDVTTEDWAALDAEMRRPGIPVEVFISTGERTALSYFVKPIEDHFERAFRED